MSVFNKTNFEEEKLNPLISAGGSAVGSALGNNYSTGVGNALKGLSGIASAIPGPWGAVASAGLQVVGGAVNRAFGYKLNDANVAKVNNEISKANSFKSDANDFDTLSSTWNNTAKVGNFTDSYIGSNGWFNNGASKYANRLREKAAEANANIDNNLVNNANNITYDIANSLDKNYAAFGGILDTNGASFDTGLTFINNGGKHEENPYGGVYFGTDSEGTPNLVEEGEAVYNDYVFSDRLNIPKVVKEMYGLSKKRNVTFADGVKKLSKGIEERPNDSISKDSLNDNLEFLAAIQESIKARKENKKFANGGKLFAGGGDTNDTNDYQLYPSIYDYALNPDVYILRDLNNQLNSYSRRNQVINKNNQTENLMSQWYEDDGKTLDFNKVYADDSDYMKRYNYIKKNWNSDYIQKEWLPKYVQSINDYNKERDNYTPLDIKDVTLDNVMSRAHDGLMEGGKGGWGAYYQGIMDVNPLLNIKKVNPNISFTPKADLTPKPLNMKSSKSDSRDIDLGTSPEWYRYTPAMGYGVQSFTDTLGLTNKPDYTAANMIKSEVDNPGYKSVGWERIGNKLAYKPLDLDYYQNKLNASNGATRRAIINNSNGNRGAMLAGLLANNYNTTNQIGDFYRQAYLDNFNRQHQVEDFNRQTSLQNSQGALQADIANQYAYTHALDRRYQGIVAAAQSMQQAKDASEAAKAANYSGFLHSMGNIGYENKVMNMIRRNAEAGVYTNLATPWINYLSTNPKRNNRG